MLKLVELHNTFIGSLAGYTNIDGNRAVGIGYKALYAQEPSSNSGTENTAIGTEAGEAVTTGTKNTLIGSKAGDTITTGDGNTIIGYGSDVSGSNAQNQMVIGNNTTAVLDNSVLLGNTATTIFHPADDNGVDLGSTAYSF